MCAILPVKAVPDMTYTVLGGTLNPTHSLTRSRSSLVNGFVDQCWSRFETGSAGTHSVFEILQTHDRNSVHILLQSTPDNIIDVVYVQTCPPVLPSVRSFVCLVRVQREHQKAYGKHKSCERFPGRWEIEIRLTACVIILRSAGQADCRAIFKHFLVGLQYRLRVNAECKNCT